MQRDIFYTHLRFRRYLQHKLNCLLRLWISRHAINLRVGDLGTCRFSGAVVRLARLFGLGVERLGAEALGILNSGITLRRIP